MKLEKFRRRKPPRGNARDDAHRWQDADDYPPGRRPRHGGGSREEWQRTRDRLVRMDINELLELEESIEP